MTTDDQLCHLQNSLECLRDCDSCILGGDFNIPEIDWESSAPSRSSARANLLCNIVLQFSLFQLVHEPTRGANILDLVLTNDKNTLRNVSVVDGIPGSDRDGFRFEVILRSSYSLTQNQVSSGL